MTGRPDACPDGGTCHHDCDAGCFRVAHCGPLSGVFPGDEWPTDDVAAYHARVQALRAERAALGAD